MAGKTTATRRSSPVPGNVGSGPWVRMNCAWAAGAALSLFAIGGLSC
jgi:hypothetical protein